MAMANIIAEEANRPDIPDKLYFRIGEVSKLAGLEPHVLRYWETEFSRLEPKKSGKGHRLYRRKDVELVLEIKQLLYEQRYTIEGARTVLEGRPRRQAAQPQAQPKPVFGGSQPSLFGLPAPVRLDDIRRELNEILAILK